MNPLSAVFLAMHFLGADPDTDAAKGIDYPETMGGATEEQLKAMVHFYDIFLVVFLNNIYLTYFHSCCDPCH